MNMNGLSDRGRQALEKVAEWLEAGAPHVCTDAGRRIDEFDMSFGVVTTSGCGTSCCIAGAIVQFEGLGTLNYAGSMTFGGYAEEENVEKLARNLLGIDYGDAKELFLPWETIDVEEYPYLEGNPEPFSDPEVAAKVIRNYLETGIIDWIGAGLETEQPE